MGWSAEYARRLGIFSKLNMDFTLALGSSSVTLYEMTKVFSQFGRLGKRTHPVLIKKVEDHNKKQILGSVSLDLRYQKETQEIEKDFETRRLAFLEELKTKTPEEAQQMKNAKDAKIDFNIFFEDPEQLIKPTTAYLMTSLLRAVS